MRVTASRTSSSASSSGLPMRNSTKVVEAPSVTVLMSLLMPGRLATESSTLRVTSVSSWLGVAPGSATVTVTPG